MYCPNVEFGLIFHSQTPVRFIVKPVGFLKRNCNKSILKARRIYCHVNICELIIIRQVNSIINYCSNITAFPILAFNLHLNVYFFIVTHHAHI